MQLLEVKYRLEYASEKKPTPEAYFLRVGDHTFSHGVKIDKKQGSELLSMLKDRGRILNTTRSESKQYATITYKIR